MSPRRIARSRLTTPNGVTPDGLGEDDRARALALRADGAHDPRDLGRGPRLDEAEVELHDVGLEQGHEGERASIGPDVVQGDAEAARPHRPDRPEELRRPRGELALRDLDDDVQPLGGALPDGGGGLARRSRQRGGLDVQEEGERTAQPTIERCSERCLAARPVEIVQPPRHPGGGEEHVRPLEGTRRPAYERLVADHPPALELDDRLEDRVDGPGAQDLVEGLRACARDTRTVEEVRGLTWRRGHDRLLYRQRSRRLDPDAGPPNGRAPQRTPVRGTRRVPSRPTSSPVSRLRSPAAAPVRTGDSPLRPRPDLEPPASGEQLLARAATALLQALDASAVFAAVSPAALGLLTTAAAPRIALALGTADEVTVADTAGSDAEELEGRFVSLAGLASATVALPLSVRGERVGVLLVSCAGTLPPAARDSLEALGALASIAWERNALAETLRRRDDEAGPTTEPEWDTPLVLERDGTIRSVGPPIERSLGYRPEELAGTELLSFVHREDTARVLSLLRQCGREDGSRRLIEFRFRHREGHWCSVEAVVTNRLADPAVRGVTTNLRDVGERTRLEAQIRLSQRLEGVGRLAGGIAHDFNNLLTAISGYSEGLLASFSPVDPRRRRVEEIAKASHRATVLTRQLLAFSRKQVLQLKVLDLNAIVRDMRGMLAPLLGENVELTFEAHGNLGHVRADPGQIEQVIMNLVVNAGQAMPGGGTVAIATSHLDLQAAHVRGQVTVEAGPYVVLSVSDTGGGMDPETQSHVFEPFFTTKPSGLGTGLGLATVYGIVKQTGGYIWVYSELGLGSTFKVYLPRVEEEVDEPIEVRAAATGGRGSETLLLVEDEEIVRELLVDTLRESGYTVLDAGEGKAALELAAGYAGSIDLLVTDLVMPGMGGRDLARRLATERPGLRSLYMSGYTEDRLDGPQAPAGDAPFLDKPFALAALTQKVRAVLDARPPEASVDDRQPQCDEATAVV